MPKPVLKKKAPVVVARAKAAVRAVHKPEPQAPEPEEEYTVESNETESNAEPEVIGTDLISAPVLPQLLQDADVHRASIKSVESSEFDSGAVSIDVTATSEETGADLQYRIFVPRDFAANIDVDPADLPEDEGDKAAGVPPDKQRSQYIRSIQNKQGKAKVQVLLALAKEQGRTVSALHITKPTSFDEYVSALNALLQGIDVLVLRNPDKRDPESDFYGQLRVTRFESPSVLSDEKRLSALRKRYRLLYEEQA